MIGFLNGNYFMAARQLKYQPANSNKNSDILNDFTEETKRNLELYSSAVRERMISGMARKCSEELFDMLKK